jgi:hypothetical protein
MISKVSFNLRYSQSHAVKDLPEWKPYNHECGYTMLLDDICQLVENPNRELIKRALKDI